MKGNNLKLLLRSTGSPERPKMPMARNPEDLMIEYENGLDLEMFFLELDNPRDSMLVDELLCGRSYRQTGAVLSTSIGTITKRLRLLAPNLSRRIEGTHETSDHSRHPQAVGIGRY